MAKRKRGAGAEGFGPTHPPDGQSPPWRRLLTVPRRGAICCVILSPAVVWFPLHYCFQSEKFVPCYASERRCQGCLRGWPTTRYGYCAVQTHPIRKPYLLAIPPAAFVNCAGRQELLGDARGLILSLSRTVDSKRGPIQMRIAAQRMPKDKLLAAWDVAADVYRRFGILGPFQATSGTESGQE